MAPWKQLNLVSFEYPKGHLGREVSAGMDKMFSGFKTADSGRGKSPVLGNEHLEDFCNISDSPARLTKVRYYAFSLL